MLQDCRCCKTSLKDVEALYTDSCVFCAIKRINSVPVLYSQNKLVSDPNKDSVDGKDESHICTPCLTEH